MKTLVVALALSVVACKGSKSNSGGATQSAGSGSAHAAPSGDVKIFVDDALVGTLAKQQVGLWPRVDTLVPVSARRLGTWQAISLHGAGAKPVEIVKPSAAYPELVPALFPDDKGAATFGMFDPVELAKHGTPALRENSVTEIHVALAKGSGRGENEHGEGGGADPAQLQLTIKTKAGDKVIEGSKLLAIPREAPPGETEGKGWKLSVLLAQAGITKYERLLLADAKGTNLTLEKQDLDEEAAVPFVKLNRQGALRFRVYRKQGETWQAGSDLRGLTNIEILK